MSSINVEHLDMMSVMKAEDFACASGSLGAAAMVHSHEHSYAGSSPSVVTAVFGHSLTPVAVVERMFAAWVAGSFHGAGAGAGISMHFVSHEASASVFQQPSQACTVSAPRHCAAT